MPKGQPLGTNGACFSRPHALIT